jgi:hypothetical protein
LLLLTGDFEEGWREYEWRWRQPGLPARPDKPLWSGGPPDGRTILVTAEQGLGDAIQFVRYLPLVERLGARVLFESPPGLAPLARGLVGEGQLVVRGPEPPACDMQCGLLTLPRFLGILPGDLPYLSVDAERVEEWRQRLNGASGMRVGLVWAGNPQHPRDRLRSIPAESFRALADIAGVTLFSAQQGAREDWLPQLVEPRHEIADTAALLMNLDLVITVDTMVAHLAGALGRPVWILLSWIPDWRWLLGREDTPWYRSARLFRQEARSEWGPVIRRVQKNLANEAAKFSQGCPGFDDKANDGTGHESRPRQDAGTSKNRM